MMKLSQLIDDAGLTDDPVITGLSADSREIGPGFLFAALPGVEVDGANFIEGAIKAGAAAVLTHEGFDGSLPEGIALIRVKEPRLLLAVIAARFFSPQPLHSVAVTGTNGKTSVASFVRQIWQSVGLSGASLGTVGIVSPFGTQKLAHTTPDPVVLHKALCELAVQGIDHVCVEASSHGLQQRRLDGMRFEAAGFTNITRDHLDYHKTFEAYFQEKQRLFTDLLVPGGVAVVAADAPGADEIVSLCKSHHIETLRVGKAGDYFTISDLSLDGFAQIIHIEHPQGQTKIRLPLVGDFQVANSLVAAGLVVAGGVDPALALAALEGLSGATGRLEVVGCKGTSPIFVDYAHTPDALGRAIEALLPYKTRRLIVIFGCGGDRDKGKRPEMGAVAESLADLIIVTDDNPRSEVAAAIRAEILAAAPGAIEIGDRLAAIKAGVDALGEGDVLLVAGKGHETGQIVGDKILPFSDHDAVKEVLAAYD